MKQRDRLKKEGSRLIPRNIRVGSSGARVNRASPGTRTWPDHGQQDEGGHYRFSLMLQVSRAQISARIGIERNMLDVRGLGRDVCLGYISCLMCPQTKVMKQKFVTFSNDANDVACRGVGKPG